MNYIPCVRQLIEESDVKLTSKSLKVNLIKTTRIVCKFEFEIKNFFSSKYVISCYRETPALYLALSV
jgi:hypothetical protein